MSEAKTSSEKQAHWESIYQKQSIDELNWTEEKATPSLDLIKQCDLGPNEPIIDMGSGSSVLIQNLVEMGYSNITACDISEKALTQNKERMGVLADKVNWLVDDIVNPQSLYDHHQVSLWHDRAVFHFLTDFKERLTYFSVMNELVKEEGYVVLATFNEDAPDQCSGLPVRQYDESLLKGFMGPGYQLMDSFNYTHQAPNGEQRPYIYTLFKRIPSVDMR